jgi:hypothetical protein
MDLRPLHVILDPRDLGLQGLDTFRELLDRKRIEVLPTERNQGVVWLVWEEIVQVHM